MKNTIKGNFVGFTNGDPTITNSKVTIKEMTNNKQQTEMNAVEYLDKVNQFAKENNTGKPRQQTAVDYYSKEIGRLTSNLITGKITGKQFVMLEIQLLEQAKEMEKEQAIKLYYEYELYVMMNESDVMTFGQFYKQTYGGGDK